MKFEDSLKRLEEITASLENPETDLEKAVELYEEGMKLEKQASDELGKLQRRIQVVTSSPSDESGSLQIEDYDVK
ncbi:MAG: exodeoxyribonuclease VII small subunit [Sphaerochaetaceae bacterium]|jgi:exodeoxyribonuclease VII small subunit|nr:exodeoxyribonuclease VII small subunit [Sphaerochaetaceae bacterium]